MNSDTEQPAQDVPRHPIAVVSERTGLSQDLLRVWERRYRAVEPKRGVGGHRLYSDADVTRLRLLSAASSAGRSIGHIAGLSSDELSRIVQEDAEARLTQAGRPAAQASQGERELALGAAADVVEQALEATARLDAAELEHLLRRAVAQRGVTAFIEEVASPLLRRLGDDWHAGRSTIAHEHLASSTVHDIVTEAMRSLGRRAGAATVLVATPTGERHAIGAALVGAAVAADGWRVLYLGADVPAKEIAAAAIAARVRVVAVSITYIGDSAATVAELRALRTLLPPTVVLLAGGAGANAVAAELAAVGVRVGTRLADLRDALTAVTDADAA
jgi:MerR family transcriptional regulator, light-induced transcriptional regulator